MQQRGTLHGIFQRVPLAGGQRGGVRFQPVKEGGVFYHGHLHHFRQAGPFKGEGLGMKEQEVVKRGPRCV